MTEWPKLPLKRVVTPRRAITYGIVQAGQDDPTGVPYIRPVDMTEASGVPDATMLRRTSPEIAAAYRRSTIRPGDLVVSIGPSFGKIMVVPDELDGANLTQGTARVAPDSNVEPRFLYWALQSATVLAQWSAAVGGATFRALNLEPLTNTLVPVPPLDEQRRIADFLDSRTARIDALIDIRTQQRSDLRSLAESATFDAVRGAGEQGARRPSGMTWITDVPSHWPVAAVSHKFRVDLGKMLNAERAEGPSPRPYLRNVNVQWDRIDTGDLLEMDFPPTDHQRYSLRRGDLLICEGGEPGRAAVWNNDIEPMFYQKALHRARPISNVLPRWLYYCLRSATSLNVFEVEGNTTTIAHLTREQLRAHRFPFPDKPTQERLIAKLDAIWGHQHTVSNSMQLQIGLLAERRRALITAVVTGQSDVSTTSGRTT